MVETADLCIHVFKCSRTTSGGTWAQFKAEAGTFWKTRRRKTITQSWADLTAVWTGQKPVASHGA